MRISTETFNVLKNFATINSSLVVNEGSVIRTMSPVKNILAEYTCSETFPHNFALYNLNEFLIGITLFQEPEFTFDNSKYVVISSGRSKVEYFYSDPSLIVKPSDKDIPMDGDLVEFELSQEVLGSLLKSSSVFNRTDLSLIGEGDDLNLVIHDKDNPTSNNFSVRVGDNNKMDDFTFNFKVENIKIIPDTYNVVVSSNNIALFTSSKYSLRYWIALEPDSTYG